MRSLFVGNFFIHTRGTSMPVSQRVVLRLRQEGNFIIYTAGTFSNRILRIADIFFKSLLVRYTKIHIDVFSGPSFYLALLAGFIGSIRRKKIILNLRGGALVEFEKLNPNVVRFLFNRTSVLVSPSLFLKEYFATRGYDVEYLQNYLDYDRTVKERSVANRFSLLWVRAFAKIYNPELPIYCLHELLYHYPQATLTMVGPDMGLLNDCINLAKRLNLEGKVNFVGPVKHQDLPNYYLTHSILLNTTSFESFGNALMESAYYGTPAVSYDVGEIPYLWNDGINIIFAKNLTAHEFANKVSFLFENCEVYKVVSENAMIRANIFSWDAVKGRWYNLLS